MYRKVYLTEDINEKGKSLLRDHGYELSIGTDISAESVLQGATDCDAILTRNAVIDKRIIRGCPKLKVISVHGVGVNGVDIPFATSSGIQVTNAARSNQNSVAEFTIGLILLLSKHTILYNNELKRGNWSIRKVYGTDLEGKTLGIIGLGRIGSLVAHKASGGFGMKVIAYKRNLANAIQQEHVCLTDNLDEVLSSSDFLTIHVPSNESTNGMIGERELSLMKSDAYLVNTARGEVIDEEALYVALRDHKIAGAAIDVFTGNVPKIDNPLLYLDNVIVTPHAAAFTQQSLERMAYQSALGIVEVLECKEPSYPVNHLVPATEGVH